MRIYLQTQPVAHESPRYVQLLLQQDLLGGWTLYRESGVEGGRATLKKQVYLDREEALQAFEQTRDHQVKRGYRIMITEGVL